MSAAGATTRAATLAVLGDYANGSRQMQLESEFGALRNFDNENHKNRALYKTALHPSNKSRNRYSDILAPDASIFSPNGTYVNANLVDCVEVFGVPKRLVAAQAPMRMDEFWDCMLRSDVELILMVTNLKEIHGVKAEQYWPEEVGSTSEYGACTVKLVDETRSEDLVTRSLQVSKTGSDIAPKLLQQVHYIGWPDFGVPDHIQPILRMIQMIRDMPERALTYVHCSAGVGRTGTLIASYIAIELLRQGRLRGPPLPEPEKPLGKTTPWSLFDIVWELKKTRFGMVQKREQYAYVFLVIIASLEGEEGAAVAAKRQDSDPVPTLSSPSSSPDQSSLE